MNWRLNFLLLIILICTSCTSINSRSNLGTAPLNLSEEAAAEARLYQLYINSDGDLLDPTHKDKIEDENEYISNILKNFNMVKGKTSDLHLVIFVHGGLNTFENATSRVNKVKDKMLSEGKYPLFISWDSGLPGNYSDHLFLLRRGIRSPGFGPLSSPVVLATDIARSVIRLPVSTYNILFGQNSLRKSFSSKEEKAANHSMKQLLQENQFKIYNSLKDTGHTLTDFWTIWNPVKLVTAPFVDGLGSGTWNSMLRRTDLVLRKKEAFDGDDDENGGAATAVSNFLSRWQKVYPLDLKDPEKNKVILIGHSMGTIIANNIVIKYQYINFSQIVYMAAACTNKDLENIITPYLERNETAVFYNLSLNPYRDINENNYFDAVPRGSLLIWIDQTLANVNSFQDRTAGYWFNIIRSANQVFSKNIRHRVHLTQFGIRDASPQNHGDFDNFPFWRENFWTGAQFGIKQAHPKNDKDSAKSPAANAWQTTPQLTLAR